MRISPDSRLYDHKILDLNSPSIVEITISGGKLWVNIDDVCVLRVNDPGLIECNGNILHKQPDTPAAEPEHD